MATELIERILAHRAAEDRRMYGDRVWGKLKKVNLPSTMVDKAAMKLLLDNYALCVLLALLFIQRNETIRRSYSPARLEYDGVVVTADRTTLTRITGMSKNLITRGLQSLVKAGYVSKASGQDEAGHKHDERDDYKRFAISRYRLKNPLTGAELEAHTKNGLLYSNGLHYFTIPACMLARFPKTKLPSYAFAAMTLPEKRLYVVLIWLANQNRSGQFETTSKELKSITGMNSRALDKASKGLEDRCLVLNTSDDPTHRQFKIVLRHPQTFEVLGEQVYDRDPMNNACNYYEEVATSEFRKAKLQIDPGLAEQLFLAALRERGETPIREANGEYKFSCPFHDDAKPSCNFNSKKGCFWCFSAQCHAKGTTLALLKQLSGKNGKETIHAVATAQGKIIHYKDPDWKAEAIYDYRDKNGNLIKQVLRMQDDEHGNRIFSQRRMGKEGWIYRVSGLKPMLFNLPELKFTDTVIITEGEKDAVTVTNLGLMGGCHNVVGTTSGGADSWKPILAQELKGKSVIVLPDDDAAGEQYAKAVQESLLAIGIEPHVVSFNGTGAKDATDYMANHSVEDLVRLIGTGWIRMPNGNHLLEANGQPGPGPLYIKYSDDELTV